MNAIAPIRATPGAPPSGPAHWRYRFTFDDVRKMIDVGVLDPDENFELLDGEIISMPAEGELHVWVKTTIAHAIYDLVPKRYTVVPDSTLRLSDASAPDPDIYVAEDVKPRSLITAGQVRLAVEVADSSMSLDLGLKASLYARHDIPDYWVVDVRAERTHVLRRPVEGAYQESFIVAFDEVLSALSVAGLELRLADLPGLKDVGGA